MFFVFGGEIFGWVMEILVREVTFLDLGSKFWSGRSLFLVREVTFFGPEGQIFGPGGWYFWSGRGLIFGPGGSVSSKVGPESANSGV